MATLSPVDVKGVARMLSASRDLVVVEDHWESGGLGSLVARAMALSHLGARMHHVCMPKEFGQSGTEPALAQHYKLDAGSIADVILDVLSTASPK
jgi:transketolase